MKLLPEDEEIPEINKYDINFVVNDGTTGIEGATVVLGETTKTTGSAGGCSMTGIDEGTHEITVSAEGYTTKTETITVSESNTSFIISLTQSEG